MMALRHRLTLLTAGTVGVTVVLISLVAYVALRSELRGQVDDALRDAVRADRARARLRADRAALGERLPPPAARAGGPTGPVQIISADGDVVLAARGRPARPGRRRRPRASPAARRGALLRDTHADGVHLRVLTVAAAGGGAVQFVRSLAQRRRDARRA